MEIIDNIFVFIKKYLKIQRKILILSKLQYKKVLIKRVIEIY